MLTIGFRARLLSRGQWRGEPILEEALAEILSRWAGEMVRRLRSLGCQPADVEDIVQETLLKALLDVEVIPPQVLRAWLFRVALNEFYSLCRSRARVQPVASVSLPSPGEGTAEERLVRGEETARVRATLDRMAPRASSLLLMRYGREMSSREIGAATGLKAGSVRVALHRARRLFSRMYGEEET